MARIPAARAAFTVGMLLALAPAVRAQAWNDERTRELVTRATERRAQQLADTGIRDYTATARGYLTFLAQVGEGFPDPPRVVKADELALEVYWRAPNYSKQLIVGRRDTLLLPTDIQYHRDHLGIVQNNFPDIIRLGEGDEVRDVPHPLSAAGGAAYDFAIRDSMRIEIPGRAFDVYEVQFRPKDDRSPAAVGAVYVSRGDAQVVRMAFGFTRAALIDKQLEDVSIVLENSLIEERFWLPRRQEVEIRRTGTWLDFPARGVIRGRWEICCYAVNQGHSMQTFAGPEIVLAPPQRRAAHRWEGRIMDVLPADVRAVTDEDVQRVQAEARALVRAEALARVRQTSFTALGVSDIIRVNRAEGLVLGAGVRRQVGRGFDVGLKGAFGFSDHEAKGSLSIGRRTGAGHAMRLSVFREYRDASDEAETSGVRNSIAAQEFGSDYTEPFEVRGVSLAADLSPVATGTRWRFEAAYEWHDSVRVAATPSRGTFGPTLPVQEARGPRLSLQVRRVGEWLAGQATLRAEARVSRLFGGASDHEDVARVSASVEYERMLPLGRLLTRTFGGVVSDGAGAPVQHLFYAGGPATAPGYEFHQLAAGRLFGQRAEWHLPISFVAIPLGRWGRTPGHAWLAPTASAVHVGELPAFRPSAGGWYPSVGLGLIVLFDLVRVDVARGLRDGRWSFGLDVAREFWRVM